MTEQDKLFAACLGMEKQAWAGLARFGAGLGKAFIPTLKGFGGRVQQAAGAFTRGLGHLTGRSGMVDKGQNWLSKGLGAVKANDAGRLAKGMYGAERAGYKLMRPVAAVGVGAPLAMAPFTVAQGLGAANADQDLAKTNALIGAQDRLQYRMQEMHNTDFRTRMQMAENPEMYGQHLLQTPGASEMYQGMQTGNTTPVNSISSWYNYINPLVGAFSNNSPVTNVMRNKVIQGYQPIKAGSYMEKQAGLGALGAKLPQLWSGVIKPGWQAFKSGWGGGRSVSKIMPKGWYNPAKYFKSKTPAAVRYQDAMKGREALRAFQKDPSFSGFAGQAGYYAGRHPLMATMTAATPLFLQQAYGMGKQDVYNQATATGQQAVDAGLAQQYMNRPGYQRYIFAAAPGMVGGMLNNTMNNQVQNQIWPQRYQ